MHAIAAWWSGISPNLQSNIIWGLPAFTVHHVLTRRHVTTETDKQTRAITDHIDSTTEARQP